MIPNLTRLSPWVINGELRNLEISMGSLFNYSFFITQNMKAQLREGPVYGTLPILYVFLARTGKTVHELNLVSLDEQGNLQIIADAFGPKQRRTSRGRSRREDNLLGRYRTETDALLFQHQPRRRLV